MIYQRYYIFLCKYLWEHFQMANIAYIGLNINININY